MNMLLHGMKDTEFEIFHGDTLLNQWDIFNEMNPAKKLSLMQSLPIRLLVYVGADDTLAEDFRFKSYGLAPRSAADFAFCYMVSLLRKEGVMAIILPHGVLFRGGAEENTHKTFKRQSYRYGDRFAVESFLFYGDSCLYFGFEKMQKTRRCFIYQCE